LRSEEGEVFQIVLLEAPYGGMKRLRPAGLFFVRGDETAQDLFFGRRKGSFSGSESNVVR